MAAEDFVAGLRELGYEPVDIGGGKFEILYTVPVGRLIGREIRLGFAGADSFPLNPPQTPHVSPQLFPLHPGADLPHPDGAVHSSDFGDDWQYWSRPIPDWPRDRSVRRVIRHIDELFGKIE